MFVTGTFVGVAFRLIFPVAVAQLEVRPIGSASINIQGIWVGEGVRSPEVRLYAASGWFGNGRGYEWRYAEGTWDSEEIYSGVGTGYSPVVAAAGAGGEKRLYVGSYSNRRVYEVSAGPAGWSKATLPGSDIDKAVCIRAAAGRNDGIQRIYVSHADAGAAGGLYEFSYNGATASWDRLKVHDKDVGEFAVADARGDGLLRIYAGAREGGDGGLVEFTWDGSQFARNVLRFDGILDGRIQTTYVGDGRGDGKNRIYVNEWDGPLHELSYEDEAWTPPVRVSGGGERFYLTSGRLRADNRSRLYAVVKGSGVHEHTWSGAAFEATVDAITSATGQTWIGDGRGDNKSRLYAGRGDSSSFPGSIAEVSDPNPPDAVPGGVRFLRGDSNADGEMDISDGVFVLVYLFAGARAPPCLRSADPDATGTVDISDAIYILRFLFLDGPPPEAPFPDCGSDPGGGELTCEAYPPCG